MEEILDIEQKEIDWENDVEFNTPADQCSTLNFYTLIIDRKKKGITHETFAHDLAYWNKRLNSLVVYDYDSIEKEIDRMNLECPSNEYDIAKLEIRYSQLTGYMGRINHLGRCVSSQVNLFEAAYKSMKNVALSLSSGTAKDKESNAEFLVQPLFRGLTDAKTILGKVDDIRNTCEFSAMNLNRIIHLRESEQKMSSSSYTKEGQAHAFQKSNEENFDDDYQTADEMIVRRRTRS